MTKKRYMAKVMHGNMDQTPGGLSKKDIKTIILEDGSNHYVSKRKSKLAKNNFSEWNKAVAKAKKKLGYGKHDFVLLKGELLETARDIYYV